MHKETKPSQRAFSCITPGLVELRPVIPFQKRAARARTISRFPG